VQCSKLEYSDVWWGPGRSQGKALARQHRDRTNKLIADAIAQHQDALSLLRKRRR